MSLRTGLCLAFLALLLIGAAAPTVHVILFYNPECQHCEKVINGVLAELAIRYDRQFSLLMVDITKPEGLTLYSSAMEFLTIPKGQGGVPLVVVGKEYLLGDQTIESQLPEWVETKLANGGEDWPGIPGLTEFLQKTGAEAAPVAPKSNSLQATFLADQPANSLAVLILLFLLTSLGYSIVAALQRTIDIFQKAPVWVVPLLLAIGLIVSSYLSYTELTASPVACGLAGHCQTVQDSQYSKIFGIIPLGIFGLAGNLSIGLAWILTRLSQKALRDIGAIAGFGFALFGVSFSIYLTFLEPFVIGATCLWCLTSATIMACILPLTIKPLQLTIKENS